MVAVLCIVFCFLFIVSSMVVFSFDSVLDLSMSMDMVFVVRLLGALSSVILLNLLSVH